MLEDILRRFEGWPCDFDVRAPRSEFLIRGDGVREHGRIGALEIGNLGALLDSADNPKRNGRNVT